MEGVQLGGPGMIPRFARNRRRTRRRRVGRVSKPIKKYVKTQIAAAEELKYFDTIVATAVVANAVQSISDVPQGNTDITRVGDKLTPRSLRLRFTLSVAAATPASGVYRLIIVQWHPGSIPGVLNIMQSTSTLSDYEHDGRSQFRIFYDRKFVVDTVKNPIITVTKHILSKPRIIKYTAGGVNGFDKIYLLTLFDNYSGLTTANLTRDFRLNFIDS